MKRALMPLLLLTSVASPSAQTLRHDAGWRAFDVWASAILSHTPGRNDEALTSFLALKTVEIEAALPMMAWSLRLARQREGQSMDLGTMLASYATVQRRPDPERLDTAADRVRNANVAVFLRRAVMLHTDVAIVAPDAHRTLSVGMSQVVNDGRRMGNDGRPLHWALARGFIGLMAARESDARLWYQAAANHLWSIRDFAELVPHLNSALGLFPDDAELWFMSGLMHESSAAPYVQAALGGPQFVNPRTPGAVVRVVSSVRKPAEEHALARDAFYKALDRDGAHVEARLRLGRMLSLMGQSDAALTELRTAIATTRAPQLVYLGQLFLGRALEALGRLDEARAAYETAANAFPRAQAPRLALSQLAMRTGDRAGSHDALHLLRAPSTDDDDPWWKYHYEREPVRDEWLKRMWAAFKETRS